MSEMTILAIVGVIFVGALAIAFHAEWLRAYRALRAWQLTAETLLWVGTITIFIAVFEHDALMAFGLACIMLGLFRWLDGPDHRLTQPRKE